MRYMCNFFDAADIDKWALHRKLTVDASDICEAVVMGLRGLQIRADDRWNVVADAQRYSVSIVKVADDHVDPAYPHI